MWMTAKSMWLALCSTPVKRMCFSLQVLDVLDCTGSGDVDPSKIVKADEGGCIEGLYGNKLRINPDWSSPSGVLRCPAVELLQTACLLSAEAH